MFDPFVLFGRSRWDVIVCTDLAALTHVRELTRGVNAFETAQSEQTRNAADEETLLHQPRNPRP